MKLLAVNINGQVLGVNILSWSTPTVSGCTPFLAIADNGVIPANYCNISSVTNWDKLGGNTTLSQGEIKAEIVKLIPNTPTEPQYRILETYTSVGLNSMTKVGNTLVFGGTLSGTTFLTGVTDSGVTKATFATYTGTTAPNTYKKITSVNYYTGTTAPATYKTITSVNYYTGTTAPSTYYNKTQINSYTGATNTAIGNRLLTTIYSTYTGTTVPTTYYNKTQVNNYTGATQTTTNGLQTQINDLSSTISQSQTFIFEHVAADIGGYEQLNSVATVLSGATEVVTVNGTQLIGSYVTSPSGVGITGITSGIWTFHFHASTSTGNNSNMRFDIYRRRGTGETLIFQTALIPITTTSIQPYQVTTLQSASNNWIITDRIVAKVYAVNTQSRTITWAYSSSANNAYIQTPISYSQSSPQWTNVQNKPSWLSGTTLQTFQTGHAHSQYALLTNAVTGATNLGSGNALYTSVSANKIQLKSISGGTGISISTTANQINICGTSSSVAWGNITGNITGQTDLNNCLNSKQATITGGATTITASNLTASRALVSDGSGKVAVSTITSAQIGYLSGTTTNIVPLINAKANIASPTFTGTVTIPTPFTLGAVIVRTTGTELNYVTGTTSNIQTQLGLLAPKANAVFTGTHASTGGIIDLNVSSNFAVNIANGTSTGTVGIGDGTGIQAINIGSGNAVKTIGIGNNATPANVITIGGDASTVTVGSVKTIIGTAGTTAGNGVRVRASRMSVNKPTTPQAGLNANTILTLADIFEAGIIGFTATAARNLTFPTAQGASGIVQNFPGTPAIGDTIQFTVFNVAAFAVTLVAGTGVTIVNAGTISTLTAGQPSRVVIIRVTSITPNAETVSIY